MLSKMNSVNTIVLHTLHPNIKHLAIITHKTNKKMEVLKFWRKMEKSQNKLKKSD